MISCGSIDHGHPHSLQRHHRPQTSSWLLIDHGGHQHGLWWLGYMDHGYQHDLRWQHNLRCHWRPCWLCPCFVSIHMPCGCLWSTLPPLEEFCCCCCFLSLQVSMLQLPFIFLHYIRKQAILRIRLSHSMLFNISVQTEEYGNSLLSTNKYNFLCSYWAMNHTNFSVLSWPFLWWKDSLLGTKNSVAYKKDMKLR